MKVNDIVCVKKNAFIFIHANLETIGTHIWKRSLWKPMTITEHVSFAKELTDLYSNFHSVDNTESGNYPPEREHSELIRKSCSKCKIELINALWIRMIWVLVEDWFPEILYRHKSRNYIYDSKIKYIDVP